MKIQSFCFAAIAIITLSSCGGNTYLGSNREAILPGERIAVRTTAPSEATAAQPSVIARQIYVPSAQSNADWTQLNGNSSRNAGHVALGQKPTLAWRAIAGRGASGRVLAGPVVSGGRVFTLDGTSIVTAFDADTGKGLWHIDVTPNGERSADGFGGGLAVEGDTLFMTSGFGNIFAFSVSNGQILWSQSLGAPSRAAPSVYAGRVFAITRDNRIMAFNASTGQLDWEQESLEQAAGILGGGAPAAGDNVVIAPFSSGELGAFSASDGRVLWDDDLSERRRGSRISVFNDVAGDPVIAGGTVYASSQAGRFVANDLKTGDRLWTREIAGNNPPYVVGSTVFIVSNRGKALALDSTTGATIWETDLGSDALWAGPVLAGGRLIFSAANKRLVGLDPASGNRVEEFILPEGAIAAPAIAGNTLYVLTDAAQLIALR